MTKPIAIIALLLGVLGAAPVDRMKSLQYLVGTWTCTFVSGSMHQTYAATFAYDMGGNWMSERDAWTGGGGDLGVLTYEPQKRIWTFVVLESERTTTIFQAKDTGDERKVWHSVFPDTSMTETIDKLSPAKYTINFVGTFNGKAMKSTDTCLKH